MALVSVVAEALSLTSLSMEHSFKVAVVPSMGLKEFLTKGFARFQALAICLIMALVVHSLN